MRRFTILAALCAFAVLSVPNSASACWWWRSRCRRQCYYYVPVNPCYYPVTYYAQPLTTSDQTTTGATGTATADTTVTGTEATDTEATDTEAKKSDPITAEEQKWFKDMYGDPSLGLSAEDKKALEDKWAGDDHVTRKTEYEAHQKMLKEADDKANKEISDKAAKP
jgi:hypothetical protein